MKLRIFSLFLCFFIFMSSFTSFADISETEPVKSWQDAVDEVKAQRAVASASDAGLMTMDVIDEDYAIMLLSSVGSVNNTVKRGNMVVWYEWYTSNNVKKSAEQRVSSDGSFSLAFDGTLHRITFEFTRAALPAAGNYLLSLDFSSDFSCDYTRPFLQTTYSADNVGNSYRDYDCSDYFVSSSGDFCLSNVPVSIGSNSKSLYPLGLSFYPSNIRNNFSGSLRARFDLYSGSDVVVDRPGGSGLDTQADYQYSVTGSLGSIGDTLEEIVETISLQLEALWNQMYNFMHLPQYEKLEQIRQAIENLDLNIDVDQSELIAKIQEQIENDNTNTDRLINSYDNSSITQSNDDLNTAIDSYDSSESDVVDQVSGYVSDFEYESYFDRFTAPMADISYFLTGIYNGLGALNIPIGFSLTLMIALICIGFYRFKGGG